MKREVTKQNLELLLEALLAQGPEWFAWYAGHSDRNGASLHFGNGYEMSIRWGPSNYWTGRMDPNYKGPRTTVEVAVLSPDNGFVPLSGTDDVLGWQDFDEIAALAQVIAEGDFIRRVAA